MNINIAKSRFLTLAVAAGLVVSTAARAQNFTTLYDFTYGNPPQDTNSDGAFPGSTMVLSGNTLYGTAAGGGLSHDGSVFSIHIDGSGFTNLYSFTALSQFSSGTNSDGANPNAVILSGNTLYGTTYSGGNTGNGTVFAINTDGSGFTNLYSFSATVNNGSFYYTNGDGSVPNAGLALSGNTLYGTTYAGGLGAAGTVFAINTDGSGFTNLYNFAGFDDGASPNGLVLSGSTLYGTAYAGGSAQNGNVFAINTDGSGFRIVYGFTARQGSPLTNSDGALPLGKLALSGGTLYGTTFYGGDSSWGTVFAVNTDGSDFKTLHSFSAADYNPFYLTNSDGANPAAGLAISGNTLYGTAYTGGILGNGALFSLDINGANFTTLYNFSGGDDGGSPHGELIISDNILYGTTVLEGLGGSGTIFGLALPTPSPQLTITSFGTDVILTWPTSAVGFVLQSTPNLDSPVVWTDVSSAPVVINGQFTVTDAIFGTQMLYRLMHP